MAKEAYYFSHDANARQDPKVLEMISVYGAEGYGRYWMIVEMMREQGNHTLKISGKYAFNALAMQLHCTSDAAAKFVHDCIEEFELFESDGELFWSNSLIRRMAMREEVSQKRKKAAEKRWGKKPDGSTIPENEDAQPMQLHSISNANGMQGKERKGKEKKEKNKRTMSKENFDEASEAYILADYFFKQIKINAPDHKEPNLQKWADEFRKILELDKRNKSEVAKLVKFVQNDSFEMSNVLSPAKLRSRYDSLKLKMQNGQQKAKGPAGYDEYI